MAYNKNYQQDEAKHQSIVRQSSVKAAVDFAANKDYTLMEVMGIAMAFTEYGLTGDFEIAKKVEAKLGDKK